MQNYSWMQRSIDQSEDVFVEYPDAYFFFCALGCVPLRWSGSGSVIPDHPDHRRSNELMNPLWTRIHQFIWSTMIRVIWDQWYWSRSSQRNASLNRRTILISVNCSKRWVLESVFRLTVWCQAFSIQDSLGPFIPGKIRRILHKMWTVPFIRACLI